jgi:hypothetical protein
MGQLGRGRLNLGPSGYQIVLARALRNPSPPLLLHAMGVAPARHLSDFMMVSSTSAIGREALPSTRWISDRLFGAPLNLFNKQTLQHIALVLCAAR